MKRILGACLVALLAVTPTVVAQSGAKEETKKAGEAAKDAGKSTGKAAKHAGKATAKAAKKGAKAVKKTVTGKAHARCVDGTRTEGDTEERAAAACSGHGGVVKN